MGKIRKAIWAFVVATGGAVLTAVATGGAPADTAGWLALIGSALGVGLGAAGAVYKATNDPAVRLPSTDPVRRNF